MLKNLITVKSFLSIIAKLPRKDSTNWSAPHLFLEDTALVPLLLGLLYAPGMFLLGLSLPSDAFQPCLLGFFPLLIARRRRRAIMPISSA